MQSAEFVAPPPPAPKSKQTPATERAWDDADFALEDGTERAKSGVDQAKGAAKSGADQAQDATKSGVDQARGAAKSGADSTRDAAKSGADSARDAVHSGTDRTHDAALSGIEQVPVFESCLFLCDSKTFTVENGPQNSACVFSYTTAIISRLPIELKTAFN
jgi:hypothetical protein